MLAIKPMKLTGNDSLFSVNTTAGGWDTSKMLLVKNCKNKCCKMCILFTFVVFQNLVLEITPLKAQPAAV